MEKFCKKGLNLDKMKTKKATYSASSKTGRHWHFIRSPTKTAVPFGSSMWHLETHLTPKHNCYRYNYLKQAIENLLPSDFKGRIQYCRWFCLCLFYEVLFSSSDSMIVHSSYLTLCYHQFYNFSFTILDHSGGMMMRKPFNMNT